MRVILLRHGQRDQKRQRDRRLRADILTSDTIGTGAGLPQIRFPMVLAQCLGWAGINTAATTTTKVLINLG